ncbi:MAG: hypothetical protein IKP64_00985 [Selenomonadaceae bacterium]|nr:hypothetical protein [Selenomonadaceae bacterium]MBR4382112.1 hypothetical protein [Selenomonadaceae bacterium]
MDKATHATELQLSMLAAKQPPLTPLVQETFEELFTHLAEIAKASESVTACEIVDRLIRLALILDPVLRQNQSFFGENSSHPYALQIPSRDLLALYAARASMNSPTDFPREK